ncbi:MAG: DegT/DnrJ/EryC1/StrS family aminotransferase [Thermoplasmata archaeon]
MPSNPMNDASPPIEIPFVDLKARSAAHRAEWLPRIAHVVDSGRFIGGAEVDGFEADFAKYLGTRYAVGTASGADALRIALMVLGIGPGDEVVTVSHTFAATADAIIHVGATPVFVDVTPETYTMDPEELRRVLGPSVKAVLPVHLYGQAADMDPILEICDPLGIPVIEDAAQAHGGTYRGRKLGGFGRLGCFSFYPSKNLGALGDAGMLVTNDPELSTRAATIRDCGQRPKYHHVVVGLNSRLDAIQATVLRSELIHLDAWNRRRVEVADRYRELLTKVQPPLVLPTVRRGSDHIFHIFAVLTEKRDALRAWLRHRGIETGIHYPIPVHLQESYQGRKMRLGKLENTVRIAETEISLPMYPEMTEDQVTKVAGSVEEWVKSDGT